nr:hypothetical protein [Tanacetum cinerariifolium]
VDDDGEKRTNDSGGGCGDDGLNNGRRRHRWPTLLELCVHLKKGDRLLPHARGLGFKSRREGFSSGAKKEWGLSPKANVRVLHIAQLDVTSSSSMIDKDLCFGIVLKYLG